MSTEPVPRLCRMCDNPLGAHDRNFCRACRVNPFPQDTLIRRNGFRIWSRPRSGDVLWEKIPTDHEHSWDGLVYKPELWTHEKALDFAMKRAKGVRP